MTRRFTSDIQTLVGAFPLSLKLVMSLKIFVSEYEIMFAAVTVKAIP